MSDDPIHRELAEASADYQRQVEHLEKARARLRDAIVAALKAGWKPSKVTELVPYDRTHVDRLRKAAGIPPRRKPTVQGISRGT